jgi:hypothetical protein
LAERATSNCVDFGVIAGRVSSCYDCKEMNAFDLLGTVVIIGGVVTLIPVVLLYTAFTSVRSDLAKGVLDNPAVKKY